MGTFTKSFAAAGGYMAGDRRLIQYLRSRTAGFNYGQPMSLPVAQQIKGVLTDMTKDRNQRIIKLKENAIYFRKQLIKRGYHIDGEFDSPVIPLYTYSDANTK